jgi:hypothetical protein
VRLPIHLCVDVEPNDREVAGDPAADWSATEPCINLLEEFRAKVQATFGRPVHINWFLRFDPQIADAYGRADYAFDRFRKIWDRVSAAGDGIGIHVHAWRKSADEWVSDHGDAAWVTHCVDEGLDAFARCTRSAATMFRFGDRFMSNAIVRQLEARGVKYDLTIEPGIRSVPVMKPGELGTGALPDYTRAHRSPFHPSRFDFRKAGICFPRRIWMVPVSTGALGPDVLPTRRTDFFHLNIGLTPGLVQPICAALLNSPRTKHLCWVARTGDFAFREKAENIAANLDYLATLNLRLVRPDEAWG